MIKEGTAKEAMHTLPTCCSPLSVLAGLCTCPSVDCGLDEAVAHTLPNRFYSQ